MKFSGNLGNDTRRWYYCPECADVSDPRYCIAITRVSGYVTVGLKLMRKWWTKRYYLHLRFQKIIATMSNVVPISRVSGSIVIGQLYMGHNYARWQDNYRTDHVSPIALLIANNRMHPKSNKIDISNCFPCKKGIVPIIIQTFGSIQRILLGTSNIDCEKELKYASLHLIFHIGDYLELNIKKSHL